MISFHRQRDMGNLRILVLGLGGVFPGFLKAMIAAGKLWAFAKLMSEGISGELKSVIHPASPTTWASVATGLNPGKHGIYDFFQRLPGSYKIAPVNARLRSGKPLWTILSEHGKRVGVFNVPLTYPPEKVNGFIVAGMDTPDPAHPFTYPRRLAEDLPRAIGDYIIDIYEPCAHEEEYLEKLLQMFDGRLKALDYLLDRYTDLDFLFAGFTAFDHFHRLFWKYIDPAGSEEPSGQAETFRNALEGCYRRLDNFISRLLAQGEQDRGDTAIIVASDRGFGSLRKVFYINKWLAELGLLKLKEGASEEVGFLQSVDWAQTKAYSFGSFGNIYLNLRGREPLGIVEQGKEVEELKKFLKQELYQLPAPGEEAAIVSRVYRKEELYTGPRFGEAPDLLVVIGDYSCLPRGGYSFHDEGMFVPPAHVGQAASTLPLSGSPRLNGFLLARGPALSPGMELEGAEIIDLVPTILYSLGLPVPEEMDGKVLEQGFKETYRRAVPVSFAPSKSAPSEEEALLWGEGVLAEELEKKEAHIKQLEEEVRVLREAVETFRRGRYIRMRMKIQEIKNKLLSLIH